jgi:UDP-2,3-diacylglucosamine pyrophosphatase LpxH
LAHAGDVAYDFLLVINSGLFRVRSFFGFSYWSLSGWAKQRVKRAVNFIGDYEETLSSYASNASVDGVICGHIHSPCITKYGSTEYMNCGDMIDSCSLLVENLDGSFAIVRLTGSVG